MNKLKNIWHLYKLDWQRIFDIRLATFLIIALMIVPSLYAWFNIKALWDPYGNTGQIPIAVYSDDEGATVKDKEVDVGHQVLDKLKKNTQLGWKFVHSKEELTTGVRSGKYYAGIYVPKTFSSDLVSITTGTIKKPKIEYYFNEKINAIAPKITDKGAKNIQEQVKDNFISIASTTLFTALRDAGYDIDANMVSINKVKNMILTTDQQSNEIDEKLNEVVALHDKLPDLKEKLAKANEAATYIPKIDEIGAQIIAFNEKMPEIQKQGAIILDLQKKIPEIQAAGKQLSTINNDFSTVEKTMNDGVNEAKQGLSIIEKVQSIMPEIEKMGTQAGSAVTQMKAFAEQFKTALPTIESSISLTMKAIDDGAADVQVLTTEWIKKIDENKFTEDELKALEQKIHNLGKQLETIAVMQDNLASLLENVQNAAGSHDFDASIQRLRSSATVNHGLAKRLMELPVNGQNLQQVRQLLTDVNQAATTIRSVIEQLNALNINQKVTDILTKLLETLTTAGDLLSKVNYGDLNKLLESTHDTVKNAIAFLEKYQAKMPAIHQEISDADQMLNGHMDQLIAGINKGAALYQNDLPTISDKLQKASDFMKNSWPSTKSDIENTLNTVNTKFPDIENALTVSNDLIKNDWPSIKAGLHKAAEAIRKSEETVNLDDIIKLMKRDVQKESDFFTNPVDLETTTMYPIANNGSASTPFYTALCLWVGALLFSSVATTAFYLKDEDKKKFTKRETYVARLLTFLTVGLGQVLIVTLGNIFLLGVDVKAPILSVIFAILVGLTFMMIIYTLVGLFGTVGKGIAIIILVLSISGGGGNYPIQVSGPFFQWINPLLPFTYAVNLLRESAGGVYWPNAWQYIAVLVGMFVVFAVAGIIGYPTFLPRQQKTSETAKKSHIF